MLHICIEHYSDYNGVMLHTNSACMYASICVLQAVLLMVYNS